MDTKILFFDIEILPRHFYTNMGADRSTLCSFGYKWGHHKKAKAVDLLDFPETFAKNPFLEEELVHAAHDIMKDADMCVHHYGDKFDFPYMNTKFIKYGLAPIREIILTDTWRQAKFKLKLSSNRLDNIAAYFDCARKGEIPVETWFDVIRGHVPSMKAMTKYCIQDVEVLHEVYLKLAQVAPPKINASLVKNGHRNGCSRCGSTDRIKYGIFVSAAGRYQKYKCMECFFIHRDTRMLRD